MKGIRLWPARAGKAQSEEVVADLDAMIAEPIAFKFQGKRHIIKPVSTVEFLKYVKASVAVAEMMKNPKATKDEVIDATFDIVASVCDSFRRSHLEAMTQAQAGALLALISKCVTGEIYAKNPDVLGDDGLKKKIG
jgi:hypothetical protein